MKFLVVLSVLAAVALAEDKPSAEPVVAPVLLAPIKGSGVSSQYHSQDNLGNYAYGYDEGHATGGSYRRESGSPGVKVGSYGLRDADGRYRTVNYVADALGYRADIQSNEPGVEPSNPASASINKAEGAVPKLYSQVLPVPLAVPAPKVISVPQVISQAPAVSAPKMYYQPLPAPLPVPAAKVVSKVDPVPQVVAQVPVVSAPKLYSQILPLAVPSSKVVLAPQNSAPKLYSQLIPIAARPQILSQVVAAPQMLVASPSLYSQLLPAPVSYRIASAGQLWSVPKAGVPHYSPYLAYSLPLGHHSTTVTHYSAAQPPKSQ